jgi:macrolide transport system ATP-binding/permease protein
MSELELKTTRARFFDTINEAVAGLLDRPGRTLLTIAGSALGVTALVASLGLSRTAGSQILVRFDRLQATAIDVRTRSMGTTNVFVPDALKRIERLNGVESASVLTVTGKQEQVRGRSFVSFDEQPWLSRTVFAASPDVLSVIGGRVSSGRMFDVGHGERADPVCVIGRRLANDLSIVDVTGRPAIFVGNQTLTVLGIFDDVERRPSVLDAVVVPEGTATRFNYPGATGIVIRADLGATTTVAKQLALTLSPADPTLIDVRTGREIEVVRNKTRRDLDALFLGLAAVVSIIGALSIANMTLVSVYERVGEIGLRRSIGARPSHIAAQFLTESSVLGVLGGIVGSTVGVLAIVGVAALRHWTPVLELTVVFLAPIVGGLVGLVSGVWPAVRAARLEPVDALRRGM